MKLHYTDLSNTPSLHRCINTILPDEVYSLAAQSGIGVSFRSPTTPPTSSPPAPSASSSNLGSSLPHNIKRKVAAVALSQELLTNGHGRWKLEQVLHDALRLGDDQAEHHLDQHRRDTKLALLDSVESEVVLHVAGNVRADSLRDVYTGTIRSLRSVAKADSATRLEEPSQQRAWMQE
ncbi:hypothetical protein Tsubulata_004335 [Turnera subulata]|uniref:NAD(P)-binding domain-containing protein n=1 Tax=Turnera subulata TaxID=218843 RepID=A0A9Q0FKR4_9ROSI|nr:hypothetical protein Tsubulata_004335 [Turnera subulata]